MLHIDPELLSSTSQSEYRRAFERGYHGLRFDASLERRFEAFYTDAHLVRVRLAGYLGISLFALFVLIDFSTLPPRVAFWTASIRLGLIIPTYVVALMMSYVPRWRSAV